jgi:hypothetical protein
MASNPTIISSYDVEGRNNANLNEAISRLDRDGRYKDLSTVIIIPSLKTVSTRIVATWLNMFGPPNQKLVRLFALDMEVGEAYSRTLEQVLAHPELSNYKYMLALETDNAPPPDGLVNLLTRAEANPQFSAIGDCTLPRGMGA